MTGINDVELLAQANDPYDLFAFKINYIDVEESGMNGVQPLYNGNISETFWRTYNDNVKRAYGYTYDDLNRMDEAFYQKPGLTAANINNYREKLTYDENGNILTLKRNGNLDNGIQEIEIDDLTYIYPQDSNQLTKVTDATLHPSGFEDDSTDGTLATDTTDDYAYDLLGNMVSDENKNILNIKYNHLNLPTQIEIKYKGNISYIYDATGRKVRKFVQDDVLTQNKQVDYADGFQYENNIIQFFPTAEGYASRLTTKIEQSGQLIKIPIEELPEDQFSYVYNYTDHLGNIRLSYSLDPDTQQLKIVEQNHYYPFGMRHSNYSGGKMVMVKDEELKRMAPATEEFLTYKYKYNGKEWQDELGLNFYDYGARNYDPALGRWMNIDPLAEKMTSFSPYNYCFNNPVTIVDFGGLYPIYVVTRSYAPFKTFGPGNSWYGDNRGATLNRSAKHRTWVGITHDTETKRTSATGQGARSHTVDGTKDAFSDTHVDNRSKGDKIDVHSYGNNAAQTGSWDIDQYTKLEVKVEGNVKKDHILSVSGTISGDDFPNQESFMYDSKGNSVWLGNFETKGDRQSGPVTDLAGSNEDNVNINVSIRLSVDKNGVFQGVMVKGKDGKETMISIGEWNKKFKSDDNK